MDSGYKALADPTRRRILELLREGDRAAGDIAAEFDISWASISHHLSVLKNAGLILGVRDGQSIVYSLNTTVVQQLIGHLLDLAGEKKRSRRA